MAVNTWLGSTDQSWGTASNWSLGAVPVATNDIQIPAGTPSITDGLDQSAVALGNMWIEAGYTGKIGDDSVPANPTFLQVDCDSFTCHGKCTAYIDLSHAAGTIDCIITDTAQPNTGKYGIYIEGASANYDVRGGVVGCAVLQGNSQTVDEIVVSGGSLTMGLSVSFGTSINVSGGTFINNGTAGSIPGFTQHGGTTVFNEFGAAVACTVYGGVCNFNNWGTSPSKITQYGGTVDLSRGPTRTLTEFEYSGGLTKWNSGIVTITTKTILAGNWNINLSRA